MGYGLPLEIISEIIGHVELRSDLYNWCLVSRATRDFATPRLFEEILVTSSSRAPIRKVAENLRGLLQLSSKRLAHVKKFEAWCSYARDTPESDLGELLEVLEACIEKAIRLEEFSWSCFFIPQPTTAPLLLQLNCLTSLSVLCPMKRNGYGFVANRAFEEQISQFKNLRSFEISNIWIPNNASARRIARVLINSPKLTHLGISLDEDRCQSWERGDDSIIAEDEDEIFFDEEEHDLEIVDYFSAICQEFDFPTHDPSTGEPVPATVFNSMPSTPLLSLRKLDLGSFCILTNHIHVLTDTSILEHIFIENGANNMFAMSSPYSFSNSALAAMARQAPNLRSVHFGSFDYDCDATDIDLRSDFPALDSFYVRDEYDGVVAELSKCGGLKGQWKRLALDNPDERVISELDDEFHTLLSGLILKCENLTHLRVGLKWKDMPLLLSSLAKLPHLNELHLTTFLGEKPHRQSMREFLVQDIFIHHPGLQIASMVKVDYRSRSRRVCWRRRWDGLEVVSMEELKLLNRDGFPRMMNDPNWDDPYVR
ncbi:hypothetical protein BKA61DRAFT_596273 [Leptodontidium sp. MPI-SDFR-AT-0119]|nr:hypothetical protein BKA61DRAFT_596273 [Leptodontidium sp. MPI-SDFR-AT-0119]